MKKILALAVALALVAGMAWGQVFSGVPAQAVTDVSVTVDLVAVRSAAVTNKGANPIYGQAYYVGQTVVATTATGCTAVGVPAACSPIRLDAGETYDFGTKGKFEEPAIRYVVLICGAGLTSTAKILAKP